MQGSIVRKALLLVSIGCLSYFSEAQPNEPVEPARSESGKPVKPFRILTAGKQVTIKSSRNIRSLMVWTAGGHRIVEEKNLNTTSYNFRVQVNEKVFFIMVQLADGKTYSEKIGVQ